MFRDRSTPPENFDQGRVLLVSERFKYSEARLAEVIGLEREKFRNIRRMALKEGRDWKKFRGEVLLSEGTVNYIARAFGVESLDLERCLPVDDEQPPPEIVESNGHPQRKKMRVVPPKPFNPRIVIAEDEQGNREIVWVGRNDNFCFNDEIEVEPHETQTGILQCVSEIPRDRRRPHR
jgi:hypothetical protein